MGTWKDPNITEASGLACSRKSAAVIFTHNDEDGPVYAANSSTGVTVGKRGVKDHTLTDPEDIDLDILGYLWLADIGDNDANRSSVAVYKLKEFTSGFPGDVTWTRYVLRYPSGTAHNAETFMNRSDGKQFIISKVASGVVYQLPKLTSGTNQMKAAHGPDSDLAFVSGGVFQTDGQHSFLLKQGHLSTIYVFDRNWNQIDTISMPAMTKPEGIGISKDGRALTVCDDKGGTGGKYQTVKVPKAYWPKTVPVTPPPPNTPPTNPCAA